MRIPYYHVDAFTARAFGGNPAGVWVLEAWLADDVLQKIAAANNLSETAFFFRRADGIHLRWFAPQMEVDLCGHATLATAHVLFSELGSQFGGRLAGDRVGIGGHAVVYGRGELQIYGATQS